MNIDLSGTQLDSSDRVAFLIKNFEETDVDRNTLIFNLRYLNKKK